MLEELEGEREDGMENGAWFRTASSRQRRGERRRRRERTQSSLSLSLSLSLFSLSLHLLSLFLKYAVFLNASFVFYRLYLSVCVSVHFFSKFCPSFFQVSSFLCVLFFSPFSPSFKSFLFSISLSFPFLSIFQAISFSWWFFLTSPFCLFYRLSLSLSVSLSVSFSLSLHLSSVFFSFPSVGFFCLLRRRGEVREWIRG